MDLVKQTIEDFGRQWSRYTTNDGYYGSLELFEDIIFPLLTKNELRDTRVAEIGSGTGRIVMMLLNAGVAHVTAIEPSDAFEVLRSNLSQLQPQVRNRTSLLKCTGDELPDSLEVEYIFCIGVLHHIPKPDAVVKAAYKVLPTGGKMLVWLYGKEGNELYLFLVEPLRRLTRLLPHYLLAGMVWLLYLPLVGYAWVCRWLPLPLRDYLLNVIFKMPPKERRLVIYDQLNPSYAKYYTKDEAEDLFQRNGFSKVKLYHRRGYSWTVLGEK